MQQPIKLFLVKEKQKEALMKPSAGELRLQKDISELNVPKSCSIKFPKSKFDPMNFEVSIIPDGGNYLGCTIVFLIQVPPIYPHEAPKVMCKTNVNHPKIDLEGNVCLNILRKDWKPVLDINNVINGLYDLLKEPIYEDPLNPDVPVVLKDKSKMFEYRVRVQSPNQDMGSMENIPQELFFNILSMLPARELMKCKCVCKSWFNFITDPHFISNYYVFHNNKNSIDNQEEHLLISRTSSLDFLEEGCVSVISCNNNESEEIFSSEALYSFDKYKYRDIYSCQIMGPCNGIYFLRGSPSVMINPSIRQFKLLIGLRDTYSHGKYPGFGFDPITNDYKVIVLNYIRVNETNERKVIAELYSLNFNSWRKLDDEVLPLPFRIWRSSGAYTYVQNCFHWWGYVEESATKDDIVLSFDMVTELFRKIKLPKIRSSSREYFTTLAPFDNSTTIGAIVYYWRGTGKIFDIWVMKDYWDEGSWIKQYSVGPVQELCNFVGIYGNNRYLWEDSSKRLVLYELDSEHTRRLKVYGRYRQVFERLHSIRGARYMESLVSLHR